MDAVSQQNGGYEKWRELYHELLPLYSISHISSPSPLLCLAREPGPLLELLEDAERSMVSQSSEKNCNKGLPRHEDKMHQHKAAVLSEETMRQGVA
ncbi:hypothetical protein SERLA73DRAFT_189389 [Serpula lacrymans var. lacrymans S7.3]|uniref:Uncharacterized protein n=1 Tax=Serpula lacrymans var. lacrymans (strain S7.3) TaxID=936435 RepID=F8QDI0_SERL3|nr:hypothetical protein SERLA73DRAFT_189389 [Serpula lacrymans var. lacrymans S7.3]